MTFLPPGRPFPTWNRRRRRTGPTAGRPGASPAHPARRPRPRERWTPGRIERGSGPSRSWRPTTVSPRRLAAARSASAMSSRVSCRVASIGEAADAHAEQADARRRVDGVEQRARRRGSTAWPESIGAGNVTERVIVRKSWNRTLMFTVRPAKSWARSRAPTLSASRDQLAVERRAGRGDRWRRSPRGRSTWVGARARRHDRRCRSPTRGDARRPPCRAASVKVSTPHRGDVADRCDAQPLEPGERGRADAPQRPRRQGVQERQHLVGGDDLHPQPRCGTARRRAAAWPPRRPAWRRTSPARRRPST